MSAPDWIFYGLTYAKLCEERQDRIAGVEVRINGKDYLIGDVNELGGLCDDCSAFNTHRDIVEAYRVLVERGGADVSQSEGGAHDGYRDRDVGGGN